MSSRNRNASQACISVPRTEESEAECPLDVVELAGALPGELLLRAPEVAVGGRALVDRLAQVEVADDRRWTQVEHLLHRLADLDRVDGLGAEGLDHDRDGTGDANGVGHLDPAPAGGARRHDVLGDPAGGVRSRAVDLARVLAREGAAAMAGGTPVGVDDDLAAGEGGIGGADTPLCS